MSSKQMKRFTLVFLLSFLFLILFIDFLHTEQCFAAKSPCPACRYQSSTPTSSQSFLSNCYHQPRLVVVEVLSMSDSPHYRQSFYGDAASRAPPQI